MRLIASGQTLSTFHVNAGIAGDDGFLPHAIGPVFNHQLAGVVAGHFSGDMLQPPEAVEKAGRYLFTFQRALGHLSLPSAGAYPTPFHQAAFAVLWLYLSHAP